MQQRSNMNLATDPRYSVSFFSLRSHDTCALSKETQAVKTKVLKVKCSKKKKKKNPKNKNKQTKENIVHYCVLALDQKKIIIINPQKLPFKACNC